MTSYTDSGLPYVYDRKAERTRRIQHRDPHMQCPIDGCATDLQPDYNVGDLVTGVISHLSTVHTLSDTSARLLAERSVEEHVVGLRKKD